MLSSDPESEQQPINAYRSSLLDFIGDPFYQSESAITRYISDGLLVIANGRVKDLGTYLDLKDKYSHIPVISYPNMVIMPGFIDTHIHYPQTEMIAAYGEQLLEWLNRYTFPTEQKFQDKAYAKQVASIFLDELLKNGTTTALVFTTVYPESVDALFEVAEQRNLRIIAGKVMMDRNAPDCVCDTAESAYQDTKMLIQKWHRQGRSLYAVTPRFAITSTEKQLQLAGKLLQEFPGVYLQTHLSETVDEVAWVKQLFPTCKGYLDVYDQAGLVTETSVFAHCVHLTKQEFRRLSDAQSAIAFCPTSNLFLGSGLFNLEQAKSPHHPVNVGLGTDIGAGTSFSMLQTTNEAYKVAQLQRQTLSPVKALFLATLGGAKALCLQDEIGNFEVGKEADFVVLDPRSTPLMAFRNSAPTPTSLDELMDQIFALMMMGDDRAVQATYIMGELAHSRSDSA